VINCQIQVQGKYKDEPVSGMGCSARYIPNCLFSLLTLISLLFLLLADYLDQRGSRRGSGVCTVTVPFVVESHDDCWFFMVICEEFVLREKPCRQVRY
jgi:hypothetical protein